MPKLKSDAWKYFSKIGQSVAECKLCGKHIKTSGNTSNLKGHLRTHQKQIDAREKEKAVVGSIRYFYNIYNFTKKIT